MGLEGREDKSEGDLRERRMWKWERKEEDFRGKPSVQSPSYAVGHGVKRTENVYRTYTGIEKDKSLKAKDRWDNIS